MSSDLGLIEQLVMLADGRTSVMAVPDPDITKWQASIRAEHDLLRTAPRPDWALYEAIQLVRSITIGASWVMNGLRPAEAALASDFYTQLDSLNDWTTPQTMDELARWQESLGVAVVERAGVPPLGPYAR